MPRFASETTVSVERSRAEIEEVLRRYGATEFHSGWKPQAAMIAFRIKDLFVRFILPFPAPTERKFTHRKVRGSFRMATKQQTEKAYDQELRSRWRALLLTIRAKLEAVEIGISTREAEFLAHIVMPNDQTVGDWIMDKAMAQIKAGDMPMLALPAPARQENSAAVDAEFEEKK